LSYDRRVFLSTKVLSTKVLSPKFQDGIYSLKFRNKIPSWGLGLSYLELPTQSFHPQQNTPKTPLRQAQKTYPLY